MHPSFTDEIFSVNEGKVIRNISRIGKGVKFKLVKGFYQDTIKNKEPKDLDIKQKSRV